MKQPPGRNEPCTCGSGKKYKKCCLSGSGRNQSQNITTQRLKTAHQSMLKGNLEMAEKAFRHALRNEGGSVEALVGLGQCLFQQWKNQEGLDALLKAGKILLEKSRISGDVRALLDLCFLLINVQMFKQALPLIDKAVAIAPDFPRSHHTRALALQRINTQEAYLSARRTVELAPAESNAVILLSVLEAVQGDVVMARQRLQHLIDHGENIDMARAKRELGVILDKTGAFEQAFSCFKEAGLLIQNTPETRGINRETVFEEVKKNQQVFDSEYFESHLKKINDSLPAPVFLMGFYRSGTTLIEQILGAHPDVVTSDEAYILPKVAKEINRISRVKACFQEQVKALTEEQLIYLRRFYWETAEQMMERSLQHQVFVDKTSMNTLNTALIKTLFPEAVLVFVIRDPRDVCLSCFMQSFSLSPLTVHFLDWESGARFYAWVMDYWLSQRDFFSDTLVELHYEDVLKDMTGQIEPLFERLGLVWSDECEQFYKHARTKTIKTPSFGQVTKPLYQTSVNRWQHYKPQFSLIDHSLNRFIEHFSYEATESS